MNETNNISTTKHLLLALMILFISAGCHSQSSMDLSHHPLNHPEFRIVDIPLSDWGHGWHYHTEVMKYLFESEPERRLAISKLLAAGYGEEKKDYLYIDGEQLSVNGKIFSSLEKAQDYIKKKEIERLLYTNQETFPKTVPDSVKMEGVEFWLIDWWKKPMVKQKGGL